VDIFKVKIDKNLKIKEFFYNKNYPQKIMLLKSKKKLKSLLNSKIIIYLNLYQFFFFFLIYKVTFPE
jgi:hypothetical protein